MRWGSDIFSPNSSHLQFKAERKREKYLTSLVCILAQHVTATAAWQTGLLVHTVACAQMHVCKIHFSCTWQPDQHSVTVNTSTAAEARTCFKFRFAWCLRGVHSTTFPQTHMECSGTPLWALWHLQYVQCRLIWKQRLSLRLCSVCMHSVVAGSAELCSEEVFRIHFVFHTHQTSQLLTSELLHAQSGDLQMTLNKTVTFDLLRAVDQGNK